MEDNQNIKAGDTLVCMNNSGLSTIGSRSTIYGLNETSINMNGSYTGWTSRKSFRWGNFRHEPVEVIPAEVVKFNEGLIAVLENNKQIRETLKSRNN